MKQAGSGRRELGKHMDHAGIGYGGRPRRGTESTRVPRRRACAALLLVFGAAFGAAARAEPAQSLTVADSPTLGAALAALSGTGGEIRLAPGDYGQLALTRRQDGGAAAPLILRSDDPSRPARFTGLRIDKADDIVLENLQFLYRFKTADPPYIAPFRINGSSRVAIRHSRFLGDNATGVSADQDGFGTGQGLFVRGTNGLTIACSLFAGFRTGLSVIESRELTIRDNEITGMRSDGMNFVAVRGLRLDRNYIHDFRGMANWRDHRDMIQFWTRGSHAPSSDIAIADNVLDIGAGSFTQSIFMRNEAVDSGRAGAEMFYRDIRITGNVIVNGHRHGIYVGETDGLRVADNQLRRRLDRRSGWAGTDPALTTPLIEIAPAARHVTIVGNDVAAITGVRGRSDWHIGGNRAAASVFDMPELSLCTRGAHPPR